MDFDAIVRAIISLEGGYVNDPADPGGETKYGISKQAFPDVDVANLTEAGARDLYFSYYWIPGKCSMLPERLRLIYFDMCVHNGLNAAAVTLQRALCGAGYIVEVDGVIGQETLSAATKLEPERLRSYRILRLAQLVASKPSLEKFWYGWYKRAVKV